MARYDRALTVGGFSKLRSLKKNIHLKIHKNMQVEHKQKHTASFLIKKTY